MQQLFLNKDNSVAIDSKQQELTDSQIITQAAMETKSPYSSAVVLGMFDKEMRMPNAVAVRYGNTIFVVHQGKTNKRRGTFRALNADTAQNYLNAGRQFVIEAYKAGYDVLVTEFFDESILNIFRTISKNPPNPDMGYRAMKKQNGEFRVVLQLGTPRGETQ